MKCLGPGKIVNTFNLRRQRQTDLLSSRPAWDRENSKSMYGGIPPLIWAIPSAGGLLKDNEKRKASFFFA